MAPVVATDQRGVKIYLPADLFAMLKAEADRDDRTVTSIVRRTLRAHYADEKDEKVTA